MKTVNFIASRKKDNGEMVYVWQRDHYHYEIERFLNGRRLDISTYLNTSYEQILEIFERIVK